MECFIFPSEEALIVALRSGAVPPELHRLPAALAHANDGALELTPAAAVPSAVRAELARLGVAAREPSAPGARLSCWAEAVRPRRVPAADAHLPLVLFTAQDAPSLLALSSELLRLGCDRQELRLLPPGAPAHALVRVLDPPWFVVSRAVDRLEGLRVFVPSATDQLFIELGASHPLERSLSLPAHEVVLITGEGAFWRLPEGAFHELDALIEPAGVDGLALEEPTPGLPRLTVTVRLARAARPEPATLFVVTEGAARVEALVRSLPEAQVECLLFAVTKEAVLLLARPGRDASLGGLPGAPYARVLELPNLYAPAGTTVEPPLRRDRLREWLAPEPELVVWLEPTPKGFARKALQEASFRPLTEWVDYVVDGASTELTAWARSALFELASFRGADQVPAAPERALPPRAAPLQPRTPPPLPKAGPAPVEPRPQAPGEAPRPPQAPVIAPQTPGEVDQAVSREEAAFLELEVAPDSPERRAAWARLAELYGRAQRPRDAGLAWAHALWEAPRAEALELATRWAGTSGVRPEAALTLTAPSADQTRGLVAFVVRAALEGSPPPRLPELAAYLDKHSVDLDVRSLWLGRVAVSRLLGGDRLGLARARDAVLARLQRGLSLERDVPRLLRTLGHPAAGSGTERAHRVTAQLENLLKAFDTTPRKRSQLEAPFPLTRAFVGFEFAWGFARLGQAERARRLRDESLAALDRSKKVNQFLTRAYSVRIDQALEAVSPETPLPADLNGLLPGLGPDLRYKVDRLRHASVVLEPQERLEEFSSFAREKTAKGRGDVLGALRGIEDAAELHRALEDRARQAVEQNLPEEERARLLDGLLDFLPALPESQALPLLSRLVALAEPLSPASRVTVLEDALKVAGHFGRTALVRQYVLTLSGLIRELGPDALLELGATLVAGVRSLRRVGLRDEAGELLARTASVLKGDDVKSLTARLGLATGFADLGNARLAQPTLDEALTRLSREAGILMADRLRLTRAAARAFGHSTLDVALPGLSRLAQQLMWITDSFAATSDYFCLSLVDFADALVLGHVGDDLALSETTRRFLEEDEFLVRRRVHRDVEVPAP